MNLEEIINAAVEKRINEIVSDAILRRRGNAAYEDGTVRASSVDHVVGNLIHDLAKEKVEMHKTEICTAIDRAIRDAPQNISLDVNVRYSIPKEA